MNSLQPDTIKIRNTFPYFIYEGPLKQALDVAEHYGFHTMKPYSDIPDSVELSHDHAHKNIGLWYLNNHEKLTGFKTYIENRKSFPQTSLQCSTLNCKKKEAKIKLTVYGNRKSISEALVIKAALSILTDAGHKNLCVDINSLGDRESRSFFFKEFVNHIKNNINSLDAPTQTVFKKDPFAVVFSESEEFEELKESIPQSIAFLSEEHRTHLKEVLEYVESMGVAYRINSDLLGSSMHHASTIFQIRSLTHDKEGRITDERILARGERCEDLSKKIGLRKNVPSVCMTIDVEGGVKEKYIAKDRTLLAPPKVYFVHLGMEAKRKSLLVLELLRKKNIEIKQALTYDSLADQMATARSLGVPYAVIMGVKEVKENSVIVRDMFTRSQETIGIEALPNYLRRIVK